MDGKMRRALRNGTSAFLIGALAAAGGQHAFGATVTGLDFKQAGDSGQLEIKTDSPVTFEKQENAGDKQIVIDVKGAGLGTKYSRPIDTSSFNGNTLLISPYPVKGDANAFRVVLQLRDAGSANVTQDGNVIKVSIPNAAGSAPAQADASKPAGGDASASTAPAGGDAQAAAAPAPGPGDAGAGGSAASGDASTEGGGKNVAKQFVDSQNTKRFTGRPVTVQVRDADVTDVLRLIGEASGFNVVIGGDVQGKITLDLVDVPWDQALDVVLHTQKLGAERNNNVLRVVTLAALTQEKQQEILAQVAQAASAPRVTKIFQVNYAKPGDLVAELSALLAPTAAGGEGGGNTGSPPVLQVDQRTHSLIVRDIPENVEKAKRLIEILDTQTPQVLIEAKVVEASEQFAKSIGGSLGLGGAGSNQFTASFNQGNPIDPLIGSPGVFAGGSAAASVANAGQFGFSPNVSFIPGVSRLNAILAMAETEEQVKVVSSPKVVVENNENATITQGEPVALPPTIMSNGGGTTSAPTIVQANLNLNVTPSVNNEGSIGLLLNLERDVPRNVNGGQAVANRNMKTTVLVESGTTLVIGGVYTMQTDHSSGGFPILRKIPILGALFGSEQELTTRTELFFFITPRVLNPKEAGLGT